MEHRWNYMTAETEALEGKPVPVISFHSINWLAVITQTECVYSAVRTGCLTTIDSNSFPDGTNERTATNECHQINKIIFSHKHFLYSSFQHVHLHGIHVNDTHIPNYWPDTLMSKYNLVNLQCIFDTADCQCTVNGIHRELRHKFEMQWLVKFEQGC
jgi:hypothetical protein